MHLMAYAGCTHYWPPSVSPLLPVTAKRHVQLYWPNASSVEPTARKWDRTTSGSLYEYHYLVCHSISHILSPSHLLTLTHLVSPSFLPCLYLLYAIQYELIQLTA